MLLSNKVNVKNIIWLQLWLHISKANNKINKNITKLLRML